MSEYYLSRSIDIQNIPDLVEIHQKSFKGFFLTFLGPNFIAKLYEAIVLDPSGIGYVALKDNSVNGFVIGTTQPKGFYGRLLRKRWWQFGWAAFPAFIGNPKILPRLLRAFSKAHQEQPTENCGELMSIAVHPETQRQGVGKQLVQAFLDEARQRGLEYVNLATDAENNDAVNNFYLNLGFNINRTYITPEKRVMNEYVIHL